MEGAGKLLSGIALAPAENNRLLNPHHRHFQKIELERTEPFHYDPRLLRPKAGESLKTGPATGCYLVPNLFRKYDSTVAVSSAVRMRL